MQDATAALEEAKGKQEAQKARLDAEWATLHFQVTQLEQTRAKQLQICASLKVIFASKGYAPRASTCKTIFYLMSPLSVLDQLCLFAAQIGHLSF